MKYKIGDKVRIKSLDWYNKNKDNYGAVYAGNGFAFWNYMAEIMTISSIKVDPEDSNKGYYFMENSEEKWTDEMIEGLVEEEEIEFTEGDKYWCDIMSESDPTTYVLPQGYQFKDENGNVINATKIVLEKKKKEYPKTYEECCRILNLNTDCSIRGYRVGLLLAFQELLICRDAYWKIAEEEIGLGKPWEPDWNDGCYVIFTSEDGLIKKDTQFGINVILAFPTEEMRDAFYENFKELIESCKELL